MLLTFPLLQLGFDLQLPCVEQRIQLAVFLEFLLLVDNILVRKLNIG